VLPNGLSILLVDDDELDRKAIIRLLERCAPSIHVDQASEFDSACISLAESNGYDCILIDYNLPGKNGLSLVSEIQRKSAHQYSAIIVITGEGDEAVAVDVMKAGAHDYLVKNSINEPGLTRALQNAYQKAQLAKNLANQQQVQKNFASLAAHELKSPLNIVSGFLQMINADLEDADEKVKEYIRVALDSAAYMNGLVSSLLSYANSGESSEPTLVVPLSDIVDAATDLVRGNIINTGAKIRVETLPSLEVRPGEFTQLFRNFISNAIRYRSDAAPEISITSVQKDDMWQITFADNGIGVPENMISKIFEPLQRAHVGKTPGHGLGLSICTKIVQSHGGKIWCKSIIGEGSQFIFTVPAPD